MSDQWWWYPLGLLAGIGLVVFGTRDRSTPLVVFGAVLVAVAAAGFIKITRT